jgi:2-iminobutanoate/2-iminopropanoate deaminase
VRALLIAAFAAVTAWAGGASADPLIDPPRAARLSDTLVVTGHVLPVDTAGRVVGIDIGSQTKLALGNLDALLKGMGSSLARAASIHVYLRNAADFAAMNAAYTPMFAADPPVRTTIVGEPAMPGALIQVAAVGVVDGAQREVVHPASWPKSPLPYSYGIRSGDTLFLAGMVARRGQDNVTVEGDIAAQTEVALQNAQAVLEAAGMSFADVVSSRVFITDASYFGAMNEAYRGKFPEPRPVRATVVCPLIAPAYKVEITLTAVKQPRQLVVPRNADGTPGVPGPNFSPGIRVGDRVWLSGLLGNTPETRGDMRAQATAATAAAKRLFDLSGASYTDVVEATVFVVDMARAAEARKAVTETLGRDNLPVVVTGTGLVVPEGLVEVMLTARTPPRR